jgi:hypothetical protein
MIPDSIWYAAGASTAIGLLSDLTVHGIQQWQRRKAGLPRESLGPLGQISLSFLMNATFSFLFTYVYHAVAAGSGRAYLAGAVVWLIVVIPILASSRFMEDRMRGLLTTRIFGWLFKVAAAATAVNHFIT